MDVFSLSVFVVLTTFSPGPNNISCASMGILYGYKNTRPYILGICTGFFVIMAVCAMVSSTLLSKVPQSASALKWIGSLYILWLAVGMLKAGYDIPGNTSQPVSEPGAFTKGMTLQLINPKALVYGMTLYSTFLAPISHHMEWLVALGGVFALVAFFATSFWALSGAMIRDKIQNPKLKARVNTVLCMMLVYTAADLAGLTAIIF
ncbi:MAG: LysE family translocator [Desulfobacterales bacterium]|nr:LysE family translocator [Desulfobacterales bacterium]